MKTESSTVQKLFITDIQALDPVTVFYENLGGLRLRRLLRRKAGLCRID